jgi:hypothetical protein
MIVATNKQQKEHRRGNKDRKEERKQNRHTKTDNKTNKTMWASKNSPLTRLYTKWFRRLQTLKFQTVISLY